ncbi:MAG TPA: M48 family metallopeptidase [Verrucomicrobiae bacterium]
MDFFTAQEKARKNSGRLVLYFGAAVVGTIAVIYLILAFIQIKLGRIDPQTGAERTMWQPGLFMMVAGGTTAVVVLGSLFKMAQLSSGGGAVARALGGRLIDGSTRDSDERKLVNIVEEMSIASGVPVPEIYVMDDEEGINAFAAGNSVSDAAVGVTRGCIQLLNRDELQGVIAHEFSHILNGDMKLNIRMMGVLFGILCIAMIGRILLETTGRRSYRLGAREKGANPLPLIGLVLFAVGYIGIFFGRLIKAAVSRQREYLADASAVQFTRNPDGIANALKKIGGLGRRGSVVTAPDAEEASHMFFGNALAESFSNLTATHPPLVDRIKAIEPRFDGNFPRVEYPSQKRRGGRFDVDDEEMEPPTAPRHRPPPMPFPMPPILPTDVVRQVGTVQPQNVIWALAMMAEMPEPLRAAAHDGYGARALVYGLLLSADKNCRAKQVSTLQARADAGVFAELNKLRPSFEAVKTEARLPLIEMAMPALRHMSQSQFETFMGNVEALIAADQQIDLFEYSLQRMLKRHLWPHYRQVKKAVVQYYVLQPLLPDCEVLLSGLAIVGHASPEEAAKAFRMGVSRLGAEAVNLQLQPVGKANLTHIDAALDRLASASPMVKKQVLDACAHAVASDGEIQSREAELLRAVADGLDCPLPPLLAGK